ncbi:MAG: dTDP-4-dehydrorhamnose 3,5-epimerase [Deltaproteobacteria bacterium]|nr:dTDP-4-dehydrorhamnose 3,5-epimerase [Deltaproteobacteria bacterium]
MKITELSLPGVLLIEPRVFGDERGFFLEIYQKLRYGEGGIGAEFVQDNLSFSRQGVLRGLHYQLARPQGKLVMAVHGEVFDVVVDIRKGSPTFGRWLSTSLTGESGRQLYVPPGYAHGFWVLSEAATFLYKVTDYYAPGDEYGIRWDDPDLKIPWPAAAPVLSEKDRAFPALREVPAEHLPMYATRL